MEKETAWEVIEDMEDPDLMFDMTIAAVWFAGNLGQDVPVDECRKIFKKIKKLKQ